MVPRYLLVAALLALAVGAAPARAAPAPRDPTVVCSGEVDDAPAINAAIAEIRAEPAPAGFAWPIGRRGRLTVQGAKCLLRSSLDLTHLYGGGFVLDLWGAEFLCQTADKPCVDATGAGQITILGLNLIGDCARETPNIGLVFARKTESLSVGADHNYADHPTIAGCFTLADYFNRSSETTLIQAGAFYNYRDHAYAAIWDGTNLFAFQSAFYKERYASGKFSSFNENTCVECIFETFGHGSVPIWIGGAVRHKVINGYALAAAADGGPAVVLSFANSAPNDFLDLGIHFENTSLGSIVLLRGAARTVIHGLRLDDSYPSQRGPIFARDVDVKHVVIEGADFHIGHMPEPRARWWDDSSAYEISGAVYSQDPRFEPPAYFSGLLCVSAKCAMR